MRLLKASSITQEVMENLLHSLYHTNQIHDNMQIMSHDENQLERVQRYYSKIKSLTALLLSWLMKAECEKSQGK